MSNVPKAIWFRRNGSIPHLPRVPQSDEDSAFCKQARLAQIMGGNPLPKAAQISSLERALKTAQAKSQRLVLAIRRLPHLKAGICHSLGHPTVHANISAFDEAKRTLCFANNQQTRRDVSSDPWDFFAFWDRIGR